MATLLISTAGQAIGNAVAGPIGGSIGQIIGAAAGNYLDNKLFTPKENRFGPRLADLQVQSSSEGAPLPRVYGRMRLAGQVIWATSFEEEIATTVSGNYDQIRTTNYNYYANFAVALCEGEINHIGRIWADGKIFDADSTVMRIYKGSQQQQEDALISAIQGSSSAPAYKGVAYVVFERLPLAQFGNRIPQFTFEVVRAVDTLEQKIKAVTLIPGATEFGYMPKKLTRSLGPGVEVPENYHASPDKSDWQASLDELQSLCPNLKSVSLIVTWFGDDLRCGQCRIFPGVESRDRQINGITWQVSNKNRQNAHLISRIDGHVAFGGTPSDNSIIAAIRDLKARGLRVLFYPFIMMDIAPDNSLPDPYGSTQQGSYPWRGRITCATAPGQNNSDDASQAISEQIDSFLGNAAASDFSIDGETIRYSGSNEGYRRFILHYAHLVKVAGGVDDFLIGSEMRELTRLRNDEDAFPFVDGLVTLAGNVRAIIGQGTNISYAADWSEYHSYQPPGSSADLYFPLDTLWGSEAIDFVGIDNYLPISDWRDYNNPDAEHWSSPHQKTYLQANIEQGEYFDWYYASENNRKNATRTPITDGAYQKPWVYRVKDLRSWWGNAHIARKNGVEISTATPWVPQSKPIRFTEFGCPAIDLGANQPNVFVDPKSSESSRPHFSNGARDDAMQRNYLEAMLDYWHPESGHNAVSTTNGKPMIDIDNSAIWTWDARPYPLFPYALDIWSDGENWPQGHWINGRLGSVSLAGLIRVMLEETGFQNFEIDDLPGVINGFAIPGPSSVRNALEQILDYFGIDIADTGGSLRFLAAGNPQKTIIDIDELAGNNEDIANIEFVRAQETELPQAIHIGYADIASDYNQAIARSQHKFGLSQKVEGSELAVVSAKEVMDGVAEMRLQSLWYQRDRASFQLPLSKLALEPGDSVSVHQNGSEVARLKLAQIEMSDQLSLEAFRFDESIYRPAQNRMRQGVSSPVSSFAAPVVDILEVPALYGKRETPFVFTAAFAKPWQGNVGVQRSSDGNRYQNWLELYAPMTVGTLESNIPSGVSSRWSDAGIIVKLSAGILNDLSHEEVFSGGNMAAIQSANGNWEIIQFADAELIAERTYRLTHVLRGQFGSDAPMLAGARAGARFIVINEALNELSLTYEDIGTNYSYRFTSYNRSGQPQENVDKNFASTGIAQKPLSPVHVKAITDNDNNIHISWIRRSRENGDSWEVEEIPLGEESERYEIEIFKENQIVRTLTATTPACQYAHSDVLTDFSQLPESIDIAIYQISVAIGRGTPARRQISL